MDVNQECRKDGLRYIVCSEGILLSDHKWARVFYEADKCPSNALWRFFVGICSTGPNELKKIVHKIS